MAEAKNAIIEEIAEKPGDSSLPTSSSAKRLHDEDLKPSADVILPATKKAKTAATTKAHKLTLKEIDSKLKEATEAEVKAFLRELMSTHSELLRESFDAFTPKQMIKPAADDPLITTCFRCRSTENLSPISECKICSNCSIDMLGKHGNLTRTQVMSIFRFTKAEAEQIPFRTTQAGLFKNRTVHVYTLPAVLKG